MFRFSCVIFYFFILMVFSGHAFAQKFFLGADLGAGYSYNSRLNSATAGYGKAAAAELNDLNGTTLFRAKEEKAWLSAGIDLEPRYFFPGDMGFGLSIGYHLAGVAKSTAKAEGYQPEQYFSATITAIPVLATAYVRNSFRDNLVLVCGLGAGYYMGTLHIIEEAKGFTYGNFKNEYTAKGDAYGVHAKAEADYFIGRYGIYGGLLLRYAKIKSFSHGGGDVRMPKTGERVEGSFTGFLLYVGAALGF
jgi:hypothetical protein